MEKIECPNCKKRFSQPSSLTRHIKNQKCESDVVPSARQKSCQQCSASKTKCDLRRPICGRCSIRSAVCEYSHYRTASAVASYGTPDSTANRITVAGTQIQSTENSAKETPNDEDLCCIDPSMFIDNWEDSMFAAPDTTTLSAALEPTRFRIDTFEAFHDAIAAPTNADSSIFPETNLSLFRPADSTPVLVKHSMQTLFRCLRTWPRMMAKGILCPPIIHHTVGLEAAKPVPLAKAYTLAKMWDGQCPGASNIVKEAVEKEMQILIDTYQTLKDEDYVAALQAIVIYTILLLFPDKSQNSVTLLPDALFRSLRDIVFYSANTGLILSEESNHTRPSWRSWINVSSKRRAVFALYLLHWSYSVYHCLPSYDCKDLGFMLAPGSKYLWQAARNEEWEKLYLRWLVDWDGKEFMQWECTSIEEGVRLDERTEKWLEDADEFGVMFMSIFNAAEREPRFQSMYL